jgi:hypothetical protein
MSRQFTLRFAPGPTLSYLAAAALACAMSTTEAQETPAARDSVSAWPSGWLVGGSLGVPGYGRQSVPELMTVGLHWTRLQPGRIGGDFAIGTMPRAFVEGVMVLGGRAGVALPLALSPSILVLPSGGVSLIGGAGGGGAGGVAGFNAGVAAVLSGASSAGMRVGITWHRFQDTREAVWLLEFGIVRIPRRVS